MNDIDQSLICSAGSNLAYQATGEIDKSYNYFHPTRDPNPAFSAEALVEIDQSFESQAPKGKHYKKLNFLYSN